MIFMNAKYLKFNLETHDHMKKLNEFIMDSHKNETMRYCQN